MVDVRGTGASTGNHRVAHKPRSRPRPKWATIWDLDLAKGQVPKGIPENAGGFHCGGNSVLCSAGKMPRRPHDEVPGYKRATEPTSHPIWARRVRRLLPCLEAGPRTAREIFDLMLEEKHWRSDYVVNVIIAGADAGLIVYDGEKWHAAHDRQGRRKAIPMKPRVRPDVVEDLDEILPPT